MVLLTGELAAADAAGALNRALPASVLAQSHWRH